MFFLAITVSLCLADGQARAKSPHPRAPEESIEHHLRSAREAKAAGQLVKAARELHAAAKMEPRDARVSLEAAQALLRVGDHAHAGELLRSASDVLARQQTWLTTMTATIDGKVADHVRAGNASMTRGDWQLAATEFEAAIAVDPARGELHWHRARARALLGDGDGALAALADALRNGFFDQSRFAEVSAFEGLRHDARYRQLLQDAFGEAAVKRADQYWQDQVGTIAQRGIAAIHRGEAESALAEFNRALKIEPDDATLYVFRARAQSLLDRRSEAAASLEQAKARGLSDLTTLVQYEALHPILDAMQK